MNLGVLIPIVAIIATAWVIVTAITMGRGRGQRGGSGSADEARENARLAEENVQLKRTVERLEERIGVLERIATDPGERTAREIDELR